MTTEGPPVRLHLPQESPALPRYCACCLLWLDERAILPRLSGLVVPWCEDCRRHASMSWLDRGAAGVKKGSWALALFGFAASLLPAMHGPPLWGLRISVAFFVCLALCATALGRLRLDDRKDSCAAPGAPVRVLRRDGEGWLLHCANRDWAALVAEACPGSRLVE